MNLLCNRISQQRRMQDFPCGGGRGPRRGDVDSRGDYVSISQIFVLVLIKSIFSLFLQILLCLVTKGNNDGIACKLIEIHFKERQLNREVYTKRTASLWYKSRKDTKTCWKLLFIRILRFVLVHLEMTVIN